MLGREERETYWERVERVERVGESVDTTIRKESRGDSKETEQPILINSV